MGVAIQQWLFRRWYLGARRSFPQLPPWSRVKAGYARLPKELAHIEYDVTRGKVTRVRIQVSDVFRGSPWGNKCALRSFAHEVTHLAFPKADHGVAFEHKLVAIKAAMEKDPLWY
jgi:hypothetical protein